MTVQQEATELPFHKMLLSAHQCCSFFDLVFGNTFHRGRKGPFNYFQLCKLLARIKHLDITRCPRGNKDEIVEFQALKTNFWR
jgi:hypothetical protein